jgi:acetyl esterase/lipase
MAAVATPSNIPGAVEASGLQPQHGDDKTLIRGPTPFFERIRLLFRLYTFKWTVSFFLRLMRIAAIIRRDRATLPTYTKTYPVRPMLSNRIFIPRSHEPGKIHRLLISIHGGGFALCDPSVDDFFNRAMADQHDFVVVSVNYRKAPGSRFPEPVHDSAEIARAVLSDTDLPINQASKASLVGFSAGGNLVLALAQMPGIKERVGAVVPVYPVVDFTGRYKGQYRTTPDGKPDMLKNMGVLFNYGYIAEGTRLSDPLLSPICVGRDAIPQRVYFVGAEYDYLCHEAEVMAKKLAFGDVNAPEDKKLGDLGDEWEKNGVKWRTVKDVVHGWTHNPATGEKAVLKQNELKRLYREVSDWCHEG